MYNPYESPYMTAPEFISRCLDASGHFDSDNFRVAVSTMLGMSPLHFSTPTFEFEIDVEDRNEMVQINARMMSPNRHNFAVTVVTDVYEATLVISKISNEKITHWLSADETDVDEQNMMMLKLMTQHRFANIEN